MLEKNSSCGKSILIRGSDLKGDFEGNKASEQCFKASYTSFCHYLTFNDALDSEKTVFSSNLHRDNVKNRVSLYKKSFLLKTLTHRFYPSNVTFKH